MISAIVLGALYARGAPRGADVHRRKWPLVASAVRRLAGRLEDTPDVLRECGLWAEATVLSTPALLTWAQEQQAAARWLTAECPRYPSRLLEVLGDAAPPVFWIAGEIPEEPFLTLVGSRYVDRATLAFAAGCGAEAFRLGYSLVSGGANGCDTAGANGCLRAGGALVEVLPFGLNSPHQKRGCRLSLCAPDETFTRGSAMERNAILYALSEHSLVAHSRFREGGTWTGATDAMRRRLTQLLVREDGSQASKALRALGALSISAPSELGEAIQATALQSQLRFA